MQWIARTTVDFISAADSPPKNIITCLANMSNLLTAKFMHLIASFIVTFVFMIEQQIGQIFVYGSLRSGFHSPAYNYISKYFTLTGNAKTKGLLIDMGNYPVAIATNENKFVVGELYKINHKEAFDFAIAQLDDYEGINAEENETSLYKRVLAEVIIENTTTQAWVYWYTGSVENKPVLESGDVLDYLKKMQ